VTIRTLLKWRNLDLSADINDRYVGLISSGVFEGGTIVPVLLQLKVDLLPFKLVSFDGMVVEETFDTTRINTPAGQTTVVVCHAVYVQNNEPTVDITGIELSVFNGMPNQSEYVVFGHIVVPAIATEVLTGYIDLTERTTLDRLGRSQFRGKVNNPSGLPSALFNQTGDFYMVVDGVGGPTMLYGWDGMQWVSMTDVIQITSDLAAHRANLFTDEKHLTDDEKLAVVGTSGTPVGSANKLIDDVDTRIPTQFENDALAGSDGAPSSGNLYLTEEYPLAVPDEKAIGVGVTSAEMLTAEGQFFVGLGVVGSANQYFKYFHITEPRGLVNTTGAIVSVGGVFADPLLTGELDPSTNPNVDVDGFYTGDLYLSFSPVQPDVDFRVGYGRRRTMGILPIDTLLRRNINDGQTSAELIKTIEDIKGRPFDIVPPVPEQNIELRKDIVDIKEYLSAVFLADHVVGDFSKLDGVPEFTADFPTNIGIPPSYTYANTLLTAFSYSAGLVTYAAAVLPVATIPGNVFIDGSGVEYIILTVPTTSTLTIQTRTGATPAAINTVITDSAHGSTKPDNNPRQINLADLGTLGTRDRIFVREIESVPNEFFPPTGNVAYQVRKPLRSSFYPEPRLRLYGGFINSGSEGSAKVVCTGTGILLITGVFTDLYMLASLFSGSPSITVRVDGNPVGTVINLSRSGTVADLGTDADLRVQNVTVVTGLSDLVPHTVRIDIGNAADPIVFYGFDLVRADQTVIAILPGRSFVQSDLYKADAYLSYTPLTVAALGRGAVVTRFINRSLAQQTTAYTMGDFDGVIGVPAGTASPGFPNFTVVSGLLKFANFKAGDIVKLVTALVEETLRILSIGPGIGQVVFTSNVTGTGAAVLIHVASTVGDPADPTNEYTRYGIDELGARQSVDFTLPFFAPADRIFTVEDGTTMVAAKNVMYSATGIDGASVGLELVDNTSILTIRAVASRLDILVVNSSSVTVSISIDGSPAYSQVLTVSGLTRIPLWLNARYQSHEAVITVASGLNVTGIIIHQPTLPSVPEGALLSTRNVLARYGVSLSQAGAVVPTGAVAVDPFIMGGVYVNGVGVGTAWAYSYDYALNPSWGRALICSLEGSYFEYQFIGQGFELEYFAKSDYGKPLVFINNILATTANFAGSAYKGVTAATGELDMYTASATPVRKKASVTGLVYGRYTIKVSIQTPRQKNPSSTGFAISVGLFYLINYDGKLAVTPSRGSRPFDFAFGLEAHRDDRNFDSGAIAKEEVLSVRTVLLDKFLASIVVLSPGATSVNVLFSIFTTASFAVTCTMINTVDVAPNFQPIVVTAISVTGFTASWNAPLPTGNYLLSFIAIAY